MKNFMIKMVLDAAFDRILEGLRVMVHKSSSKVDDKLIETLTREKGLILAEIRRVL